MAAVIGTYNYTYGTGAQQNREIRFSRTGVLANTIRAEVYVFGQGPGVGAPTCIVPGNQISVEMESTTQKMHRMMQARAQNQAYSPLPNELFSNLSSNQQDGVMQSIASRHISVTNSNPVIPGGHEVVTSLVISALP